MDSGQGSPLDYDVVYSDDDNDDEFAKTMENMFGTKANVESNTMENNEPSDCVAAVAAGAANGVDNEFDISDDEMDIKLLNEVMNAQTTTENQAVVGNLSNDAGPMTNQSQSNQSHDKAIIRIQAHDRGHNTEPEQGDSISKQASAATTIQRVTRGKQARKYVAVVKRNARNSDNHNENLQAKENAAATTIQRIARGRQARKAATNRNKLTKGRGQPKIESVENESSATTIQRIARGRKARKEKAIKLQELERIQKEEDIRNRQNTAAIMIQKRVRGMIAREEVALLRETTKDPLTIDVDEEASGYVDEFGVHHYYDEEEEGEEELEVEDAELADESTRLEEGRAAESVDKAEPDDTKLTTPRKTKRMTVKKSPTKHVDIENLGENFLSTPWVPPTIERVKEYQATRVYREGTAPLNSIKIVKAADLGVGVCLYFQFLQSMMLYFLIASILSIPSIVLAYFGSRIAPSDQDALGLYRFTLGNMGYDPLSSTYEEDSMCRSATFAGSNGTCLHLPFSLEISTRDAGYALTGLELLQVVIFLIFIWRLRVRTKSLEKELSSSTCKISDYTIMVQNLPPLCTSTELIEHFSKLYQLESIDWRQRPGIKDYRPTEPIFHNVENSWVALCTIHKAIGKMIYAFQQKVDLIQDIKRTRAMMKMYAEGTSHKKGPNKKKFEKLEKKLAKDFQKMQSMTKKVASKLTGSPDKSPNHHSDSHFSPHRKSRVRPLPGSHNNGKNHSNMQSIDEAEPDLEAGPTKIINICDPQHSVPATNVAAFVTFEYCESFARCLEDYERYTSFPFYLCYPAQMKFQGHKLKIRKAPEPDEIVWENIELGHYNRLLRRLRTGILSSILLLIVFVALLQTTYYKNKLKDKIPNLSICNSLIPSMYLNGTGYSASEIELIRPPEPKSFDDSCDAILPGSFYAVYAKGGNYSNLVGSYDYSVCSEKGYCPSDFSQQFCPCISTKIESKPMCAYHWCLVDSQSAEEAGVDCTSFAATTIASCYCMDALFTALTTAGPIGIKEVVDNEPKGCQSFFIDYASGTALQYTTIFVTVIVNKYLLILIGKLVDMECHISIDKAQGSLMYKIFLSMYFNMAVLVLLASGKSGPQPDAIAKLGIMQGLYSDLDSKWFGNIGTFFILTFIIQCVSPIATSLVQYYLLQPLIRCWVYPSIRAKSSLSIAIQNDLNVLEVGPIFDATTNQAQVLALVFFAMTYAAGLPIAMPLMLTACGFYFTIDKLFLCRYFQKPPKLGNQVMAKVLDLLFIAALLRICVACWMYGLLPIPWRNSGESGYGNFDSSNPLSVSGQSYSSILNLAQNQIRQSYSIVTYLTTRLFKPNVFPMFIVLLLLVVSTLLGYLFRFIYKTVPIFWLWDYIYTYCSKSRKVYDSAAVRAAKKGLSVSDYDLFRLHHPLRKSSAPMTREYFEFVDTQRPRGCCKGNYVQPHPSDMLTEEERAEGWLIIVLEKGHIIKAKRWQKQPPRNIHGGATKAFERKKTFEVIKEHACSTYALDEIPLYRTAAVGIIESLGVE